MAIGVKLLHKKIVIPSRGILYNIEKPQRSNNTIIRSFRLLQQPTIQKNQTKKKRSKNTATTTTKFKTLIHEKKNTYILLTNGIIASSLYNLLTKIHHEKETCSCSRSKTEKNTKNWKKKKNLNKLSVWKSPFCAIYSLTFRF